MTLIFLVEFQAQNRAGVVSFPSTVVVLEKVGESRVCQGWALAEVRGLGVWCVSLSGLTQTV